MYIQETVGIFSEIDTGHPTNECTSDSRILSKINLGCTLKVLQGTVGMLSETAGPTRNRRIFFRLHHFV